MLQQNELFRSHVFGSFKDLTHAILLDPAMMLYLDTRNSRKGKPNENTRYNLAGFITKGAEEGGSAMSGERMKLPGMRKNPRGAGRRWNGPDYEKIAPRTLRGNPTQLVDSLIFRFFQGPMPDKARGSFIEYATAKMGVVFTNKEIAELCHLMLSTPYYQLC